MTLNEILTQELFDENLILIERNLKGLNGAIIGDTVYIDAEMATFHKNEILRHELEHHYTNPHNLLKASKELQDKFERIADRRTVCKLVPLNSLISLYKNGIRASDELADALEFNEAFLYQALKTYQSIFGYNYKYKDMMINFLPFSITK